jgi:hypothetical protein
MQALSHFSNQKYSTLNWLEFSLIALSSILLGIWAAANTIALRNILLVLGTLISIVYFYQLHRQGQLKQYFGWRNSIPLFCIIGLFLWVLAHCFLFPTDYETQIGELQSTWLRSALAAATGVATGIAINRNQTKIYCLWVGMSLSFVFLLGQYLIDVWQVHRLYTGRYMQYIFLGKVNGVLIGILLIAGLLGSSLFSQKNTEKDTLNPNLFKYCTLFLVLFSFTVILETRNGLGIAFILIFFWLLFAMGIKQGSSLVFSRAKFVAGAISVFIALIVINFHKYPQWINLQEDFVISSQIYKYTAWKHAEEIGPPSAANGRNIGANTYSRIAWISAGLEIAKFSMNGHGVLHESFQKALNNSIFSDANVKSTHSAILDLYFSFGFIGVFLIISSLIALLILNGLIFSDHNIIVLFISLALLLLISLTEITRQHAIELIFYFICTCCTLGVKPLKKEKLI